MTWDLSTGPCMHEIWMNEVLILNTSSINCRYVNDLGYMDIPEKLASFFKAEILATPPLSIIVHPTAK